MNAAPSILPSDNPRLDADAAAPRPAITTLRRFLSTLIARYDHWRAAGCEDAQVIDERQTSLALAESRLRLRHAGVTRPAQIVVIGPTQAGKSSVVNLLLGAAYAGVSPLAGFTVHGQGFACDIDPQGHWLADLFPDRSRVSASELRREQLLAYSVTGVEPARESQRLSNCVVWDTPDFDSLAARDYRRSVLELVALADLLVVCVSKEKYADLSVWRLLRLVTALEPTMLIVLNKLTPDAIAPIRASLCERLRGLSPTLESAPVVPIEYAPDLQTSRLTAQAAGVDLRNSVIDMIAGVQQPLLQLAIDARRARGAAALLRTHWKDWTSPIAAERDALNDWSRRVTAALRSALAAYEREYLNHPQRYDSFRRATLELLNLLEIPGIAGVLGQVRNVVTWPARRLLALGHDWWHRKSRAGPAPPTAGNEEAVVNEIIERTLTGLLRDAVRSAADRGAGAAVWSAIATRIDHRAAALRQALAEQAREARTRFAPEIHAAAGRLYDTLATRPAMLNSLRAARATADVASVAFAIKTGGTPLHDLLIAPATFALTSLLTEGALGGYMSRIADELRQKQLDHARRELFEGAFAVEFANLVCDLADDRLFGVPGEALDEAERALAEWERATA